MFLSRSANSILLGGPGSGPRKGGSGTGGKGVIAPVSSGPGESRYRGDSKAFEKTDTANDRTREADESGGRSDHLAAAKAHENASDQHTKEAFAARKLGAMSTAAMHSKMAADHNNVAVAHRQAAAGAPASSLVDRFRSRFMSR